MILQATENCFWMMVYLARVKNSAQYLSVSREAMLNDHSLMEPFSRFPLIEAAAGFVKIQKSESLAILDGLTWNQECENSIYVNYKKARSNANLIRSILPEEFWISLNDLWIWLNENESHKSFENDKNDFYNRLVERYHLLQGIIFEDILHDKAYHFMQIGMLFEQTIEHIKIVNLSFKFLQDQQVENRDQFWIAILKGLHAWEPFQRIKIPDFSNTSLIHFLLCNPLNPHSTHFYLNALRTSLQAIDSPNVDAINNIRNSLLILENALKEKKDIKIISDITIKIENEIEALFDLYTNIFFKEAL